MKKYIYSFVLFAVAFFCFPKIYGQDNESSNKQEIYVRFINSTDTEAHLRISEEKTKRPYIYMPLKEINLSPGQIESTSLYISLNSDKKATLSVFTSGGDGYGETGSDIEIAMTKSDIYNIELTESWIYPGDDFWYVDPFRVIKARLE